MVRLLLPLLLSLPTCCTSLSGITPVRREGKVQCLTTLPDWSLTFPAAVVEECPQRCAELGPIGCVWLAITRSADGGFMCFVHDDAMVEPLQDCEHDESSLAVDADFEYGNVLRPPYRQTPPPDWAAATACASPSHRAATNATSKTARSKVATCTPVCNPTGSEPARILLRVESEPQ